MHLEYLKTWKKDKENWKFSKQMQNWLLKHLLDRTVFKNSKFKKLVLPYVGSIQGQSKENLLAITLEILNDDEIQEDLVKLSEEMVLVKATNLPVKETYAAYKLLKSKHKRAKKIYDFLS